MKRRNFVRGGVGALATILAGGAKLLAAVRPTAEEPVLSRINEGPGTITSGTIQRATIGRQHTSLYQAQLDALLDQLDRTGIISNRRLP